MTILFTSKFSHKLQQFTRGEENTKGRKYREMKHKEVLVQFLMVHSFVGGSLLVMIQQQNYIQ